MTGDLLIFLRSKHAYRAARCEIIDGVVQESVPDFVEAYTDPGQTAADHSARLRIVFSYTPGEEDQVYSIQRSDHCGYLLAERIAERLNGKSRIGV